MEYMLNTVAIYYIMWIQSRYTLTTSAIHLEYRCVFPFLVDTLEYTLHYTYKYMYSVLADRIHPEYSPNTSRAACEYTILWHSELLFPKEAAGLSGPWSWAP